VVGVAERDVLALGDVEVLAAEACPSPSPPSVAAPASATANTPRRTFERAILVTPFRRS
jgi:hypothetical protein